MKKIITTVIALTFALGLAGAASAQVVKTPEKPLVKETQAQAAPKPGEPVAQETVKPGDKTKEAVKPGEKEKSPQAAKKEAKKAAKKGKTEKKPGAHMETVPGGAK